MASDTNTKKTKERGTRQRWLRLAPERPDLPEFGPLFDLYWGGPERRITGITLRIIGVNAFALLILMFGILFLGQYQNNLIQARLETFQTELELIAVALSNTDAENTQTMAITLAQTTRQRIRIFDENKNLLIDTRQIREVDDRVWRAQERYAERFHSVEVLKNMTRFLIDLLPDRKTLPLYSQASDIPDLPEALNRQISLSVWQNDEDSIFLSAAAPLIQNGDLNGAVLITREATQIERDIGMVWGNVMRIFLITLILTIMLSIYLSGTIARPLRKLAKAADDVKRGKSNADAIPDLSYRNDEIGELSVVLRQMTSALWDRMDANERFAADVAHELKNPLTSVKSAIETAAVVHKPADREKLMGIIKHDVERLDRLITDISNASRIESELSREAFEKISLRELLVNLLDAYAADPLARNNVADGDWSKTIKAKNATIEMQSTSKRDIFVWGVESRLAQVFQNLLNNALSFTPENGKILVSITRAKDKVHISFQDQGPGIPEGKLNSIFERFYSERPEHENYGQHSGLGLSISKQIIKAHGGDIFAENTKGAKLTVVLKTI